MMRAECLVGAPENPWSAIVKCEEKEHHNDSGISPGRSSSDANSNSPQSPGRSGFMSLYQGRSPDRQTVSSGSPHSPATSGHFPRLSPNSPNITEATQRSSPNSPRNNSAFPSSPSAMSEAPESSLERLKMALERSSALSGIFTQVIENEADGQQDAVKKEYPCPLCAYATPYRHRYMEHVATHYADKCTLCDFSASSSADLRAHLSEAHNISDLQDFADPTDAGSDGPGDDEASGKRSKSKTFKCKQCPFETRTKLEFWDHTKTHIKAEKLLTCPKCPFVTEYKHHLEYHLRNHFGSKPFRCPKCPYSCVNKSMLNSHLKSHSNVYQYRCADCAYATKYCHSLKLHLRKYEHNPAMVLNADGSPNPLPIIDVYGTRRGPKQKNSKNQEGSDYTSITVDPHSPKHNLPGGVIVPSAPLSSPNRSHPLNTNGDESPHNGLHPKLYYCQLCDFYSISPEILNQHMYLHAAESPMVHMFRTNNNLPDQSAIKEYFHNVFLNMSDTPVSPVSLVSPNTSPQVRNPLSPLDLSKPEIKPCNVENGKANDGKKNRRKGKAFKLERPADIMEVSMEVDDSYKIKIPDFKPKIIENGAKTEEYNCNFCDIAFKDVVMYTMHMGYHGYQDPYTCNMCGQVTPDKVAFFIHIARSSHS